MTGRPTIGFAVPAWRAAGSIGETLDSALAQIDVELRVFVGIDGGDDETAPCCSRFEDERLEIRIRDRRLGWVENKNATLREAAGSGVDYVALLPHDDIVAPDYAARLIAEIAAYPGTAVAYSDIRGFGDFTGLMAQPSALGPRIDRLDQLLRGQMGAVSIRGVMPAETVLAALPFRGNRVEDYAADSVWMLRQAAQGELRRLAEPLYRKRYHSRNTHHRWASWNRARRVEAFLVHCEDCLRTVLPYARSRSDRARLAGALRARIERFGPADGALEEEERESFEALLMTFETGGGVVAG